MADISGFVIGDIEFRCTTEMGSYQIWDKTYKLCGHDVTEAEMVEITRSLLNEFPQAKVEQD